MITHLFMFLNKHFWESYIKYNIHEYKTTRHVKSIYEVLNNKECYYNLLEKIIHKFDKVKIIKQI